MPTWKDKWYEVTAKSPIPIPYTVPPHHPLPYTVPPLSSSALYHLSHPLPYTAPSSSALYHLIILCPTVYHPIILCPIQYRPYHPLPYTTHIPYSRLCNVPFPQICNAWLNLCECLSHSLSLSGLFPVTRPCRAALMEHLSRYHVPGWLLRQSNKSGGLCITFSSPLTLGPGLWQRCQGAPHLLRHLSYFCIFPGIHLSLRASLLSACDLYFEHALSTTSLLFFEFLPGILRIFSALWCFSFRVHLVHFTQSEKTIYKGPNSFPTSCYINLHHISAVFTAFYFVDSTNAVKWGIIKCTLAFFHRHNLEDF